MGPRKHVLYGGPDPPWGRRFKVLAVFDVYWSVLELKLKDFSRLQAVMYTVKW